MTKEIVTVTKKDLVNAIAEKHELTKKKAAEIVADFNAFIVENVAKGHKVQFSDLGKFELRERAERNGRNPQTGEKLVIPASVTPAFKAGKAFKDAVK